MTTNGVVEVTLQSTTVVTTSQFGPAPVLISGSTHILLNPGTGSGTFKTLQIVTSEGGALHFEHTEGTAARCGVPVVDRTRRGWPARAGGTGVSSDPMTTIDAVMAQWALLDEDVLANPWSWRDKPMELRFALYRTLEDAQEALVPVSARQHPESRRILALAQRAFGSLKGLLIGLPEGLLDAAPRAGEWPLRETLRHVMLTERRYFVQTAWALERTDADPIRVANDRMPTPEQMDVSGDVATILSRLGESRAETGRRLGAVAPAAMTRPTQWVHYDIDVRFRLHRFAAHLVEHTVQCEKTLAALGRRDTEGRRVVRQIWATLGELEGLGATAEVSGLEKLIGERAATTRAT